MLQLIANNIDNAEAKFHDLFAPTSDPISNTSEVCAMNISFKCMIYYMAILTLTCIGTIAITKIIQFYNAKSRNNYIIMEITGSNQSQLIQLAKCDLYYKFVHLKAEGTLRNMSIVNILRPKLWFDTKTFIIHSMIDDTVIEIDLPCSLSIHKAYLLRKLLHEYFETNFFVSNGLYLHPIKTCKINCTECPSALIEN